MKGKKIARLDSAPRNISAAKILANNDLERYLDLPASMNDWHKRVQQHVIRQLGVEWFVVPLGLRLIAAFHPSVVVNGYYPFALITPKEVSHNGISSITYSRDYFLRHENENTFYVVSRIQPKKLVAEFEWEGESCVTH
jgi:hypothetical protein